MLRYRTIDLKLAVIFELSPIAPRLDCVVTGASSSGAQLKALSNAAFAYGWSRSKRSTSFP